ncbi:MAG: MATE family efflux transporter [Pseudomonadota bacterium]
MSTEQMSYPAHARAVLRLGLPLIGGHLGQVAIGVTDTVMLGWYGVESLAAGTLAHTYFFVLFLMGAGFAWAVMPLVAAFDAQGDQVNVRRATRMGLWLSLAFAALALPLMIFSEPILRLLGQGDAVSALASEYLALAGIGIFPALTVMVIKSYLAALERTQVVFWITIVAAISNGLANYAFIFGHWGAPELGIAGAALASIVTQMVMLLGVVLYAVLVLPEHALFKRFWRSDWEMLGRVFRLGWPIGLTSLSEVGLFAASAFMMGWLGTIPLAAHGIAVQLASITFMVHLGLANVATIRAGNALGRGDRPHMAQGAQVVTVLSLAMAVMTILAFVIWPEPLISLFMQENEPAREEIMAIGIVLLALAALFQLVDGAQVVALGLLRGVQDTTIPMVLAGISYWLVGIPCSYVLGFVLGWSGPGVWLGLVVGLACAGVLLMTRFWGSAIRRVELPAQPA